MESVTLELRPRLRSCNVFISVRNMVDLDTIQLRLNEDIITFKIDDTVNKLLLSFVKILPNSLCLLKVSGNWISFRIQTKPFDSKFGSFETEIVAVSDVQSGTAKSNVKHVELPLKEHNYVLHCTHCENVISNTVHFKKVLPLPSSDCDPNEWFCCQHNGNEYSTLLNPRESDYFYGAYYCILHKNIFKANLKLNETVVCNRCLSVLGMLRDDNSVKIWNCCVKYKLLNEPFLTHKASDPLDDFILITKSFMDDIANGQFLLEASTTNGTHYMLIQPMDRQLEVLVEPDSVNDNNLIHLRQTYVTKVLYKYGENKTELACNTTQLQYCQVALPIMLAGIEHLLSSTKRFPPAYRVVDKLHVGYISK